MTALSEFDIIRRYFTDIRFPAPACTAITLGVGDDAAVIQIPESHELVFSIDTQLEKVHFPADAEPALIAQRAFRCALSDLAAMGAEPLCFTLALSLPSADERWLQGFSDGLKTVAKQFHCSLVGGDTTCGPLAITIQVHGIVPKGKALKRSKARVNDLVFVSGYLGNSAGYVQLMQENRLAQKDLAHAIEIFSHDYFLPTPQITLGNMLREHAHSAIDISDGLLADLAHICRASEVRAEIQLDKLPLMPELKKTFGIERARLLGLTGGDDYQLCFTAPENKWRRIFSLSEDMECSMTIIGKIVSADNNEARPVTCYDDNGMALDIDRLVTKGYSHF